MTYSQPDESIFSSMFTHIFAGDSFQDAFGQDLFALLSLREQYDRERDNGSFVLFRAMRRIVEREHEECESPKDHEL